VAPHEQVRGGLNRVSRERIGPAGRPDDPELEASAESRAEPEEGTAFAGFVSQRLEARRLAGSGCAALSGRKLQRGRPPRRGRGESRAREELPECPHALEDTPDRRA
jgi:hypothetical protein